jgi:hypothetical protein
VDELEKALKAALRREAAPQGFSEQVLRKASPRPVPATSWWRMPLLRWSLASAVVVACIAGGVSVHISNRISQQKQRRDEQARREQIRGEQARQQVLMALRITGTKLRVVQSQIARTTDQGREQ